MSAANPGLTLAALVRRVETRWKEDDLPDLRRCGVCSGELLETSRTAGVLRLECPAGHFERRIGLRDLST